MTALFKFIAWPFVWLLNRQLARMGRKRRQQAHTLLQDGAQCLAFSYATRGRSNPRCKASLETYHRRLRPIAPSVLPAPTQEDHI